MRLILAKVLITASFMGAGIAAGQEILPQDIKWLSNDNLPEWSSEEAVPGGVYEQYLTSFPLSLRLVGPDSNGGFASVVRSLTGWSLISEHPNTEQIIPQLATQWAFAKDHRTMFFKLNPNAKWSDGTQISADDYVYTLEFYRSPEIVDPWYNNYYKEFIDKVVKFDDFTIAVVAKKDTPEPELHRTVSLAPLPRQFFGKLDKDYVKTFNWKIQPNPGPYDIVTIDKGKSIVIQKKKDWWLANQRYYRHRFNVDTIKYKVIRDTETAYLRFLKGELTDFGMTVPEYWHDKTKTREFENGWINRLKFYTDKPQPKYGIWINTSVAPYNDINVRYALAHAINFDKINETVLRGDYERMNAFFEGVGEFTNKEIRARPFSCEKVSEYMTKSGWKRGGDGLWAKDGKAFAPELLYQTEIYNARLVVMQEEAKKCGIGLKMRLQQGEQGFKVFLEKKFDIAFMGMSSGLTPSPWQFMHSSNAKPQTNNFTMVQDKALDALIDKFDQSTETKERQKLSREIQAKWHEIGSWIPLYRVPYFRVSYWRFMKLPKVPATKRSAELFDPLDADVGGLFWIDQKLKGEVMASIKSGKKYPVVIEENKVFKP